MNIKDNKKLIKILEQLVEKQSATASAFEDFLGKTDIETKFEAELMKLEDALNKGNIEKAKAAYKSVIMAYKKVQHAIER